MVDFWSKYAHITGYCYQLKNRKKSILFAQRKPVTFIYFVVFFYAKENVPAGGFVDLTGKIDIGKLDKGKDGTDDIDRRDKDSNGDDLGRRKKQGEDDDPGRREKKNNYMA